MDTTALSSLPTGPTITNFVKDENGAFYKIIGGKRYFYLNTDAIQREGKNPNSASQLPGSLIKQVPFRKTIAWIARRSGPSEIYLIDGGKKRPIKYWWRTFWALGLSFSDIRVNDKTALSKPTGQLFSLVVSDPAGRLFLLDNETKHRIRGRQYLRILGISRSKIGKVSYSFLRRFQNGKYFYPVVVSSKYPNVFWLIDGKGRYYIPNTTFRNWRFKKGRVLVLNRNFVYHLAYKGELTNLIKGSSPNVFLVIKGRKVHIPNPFEFRRLSLSWFNVRRVSNAWIRTLRSRHYSFSWILANVE